jgi:AraC family transcriptional regulator of adaptative response/methylated-DNA-[protein]-cysteine methyltransferase
VTADVLWPLVLRNLDSKSFGTIIMPETIRYAWGESSLGDFIIAVSDVGLVAFEFASKKAAMEDAIRSRLPTVDLVLDQDGLAEPLARIENLIEKPGFDAKLELDLRGTPYEISVWKMLQEIPTGETTNYGALAAKLGTKDAREVTAAIASNPIAILVPCHRVIKKDGSISGFRWGVARKKALLDREAGFLSRKKQAHLWL